jgi:hypothetical protein
MQSDELTLPASRKRYVPRKIGFAALHVGNTKGHDLINRGLIKAVKLDGKTLIDMDSVDAFLSSLPETRAPWSAPKAA